MALISLPFCLWNLRFHKAQHHLTIHLRTHQNLHLLWINLTKLTLNLLKMPSMNMLMAFSFLLNSLKRKKSEYSFSPQSLSMCVFCRLLSHILDQELLIDAASRWSSLFQDTFVYVRHRGLLNLPLGYIRTLNVTQHAFTYSVAHQPLISNSRVQKFLDFWCGYESAVLQALSVTFGQSGYVYYSQEDQIFPLEGTSAMMLNAAGYDAAHEQDPELEYALQLGEKITVFTSAILIHMICSLAVSLLVQETSHRMLQVACECFYQCVYHPTSVQSYVCSV